MKTITIHKGKHIYIRLHTHPLIFFLTFLGGIPIIIDGIIVLLTLGIIRVNLELDYARFMAKVKYYLITKKYPLIQKESK